MDLTQIPPNIRAELARQGHTQEWLAEAAGIAGTTFGRRLADPKRFTIAELDRIARALGVPLSRLTDPNVCRT